MAECVLDSDCMLVDNCCECDSKPLDAVVTPCDGNCLQSTCDAEGLSGVKVACRLGVCEFAAVNCGVGPVGCNEIMPSCPPGTQNSVQEDCWGPCMLPRYCLIAESCIGKDCGEGWVCVWHNAGGGECVRVPLECGAVPTCTCMAPYAKEFCPVVPCVDGEMGQPICQDDG